MLAQGSVEDALAALGAVLSERREAFEIAIVGGAGGLSPSPEELIDAAVWVQVHQAKRFRSDLVFRLSTLGVKDAEHRIP
jgi:hypothetical protein